MKYLSGQGAGFASALVFTAASLCSAATQGKAATDLFTAGTLYEFCSAPDGTASKMACDAYIRGVLDAMALGDGILAGQRRYCPPTDGVSKNDGVRIVWAFLHDHPEELRNKAGVLATVALSIAFHCR